jgi:Ca2+-binding RTX toxin-like protein
MCIVTHGRDSTDTLHGQDFADTLNVQDSTDTLHDPKSTDTFFVQNLHVVNIAPSTFFVAIIYRIRV